MVAPPASPPRRAGGPGSSARASRQGHAAYLHDTARDPDLAGTIEALTMRGYALSLYELPRPGFDASLLERFGTVEVDFTSWSEDEAALAVPLIRSGRATPLAAGLIDYHDFERAQM